MSDRPVVRRGFIALVVAVSAATLAACGSSSNTSSPSTSTTQASQTSASLLAQSARIAKQANSGLVYSAADTSYATPAQIKPVTSVSPAPSKRPDVPTQSVYLITCYSVGSCPYAAVKMGQVFKKLGWKTKQIDTDSTPASAQQAFETAIAAKATVIVGSGVPGKFVGQQLAEAKKAGILTVEIWDSPRSGPGWDAHVDAGHGLEQEVIAAQLLAEKKEGVHAAGIDTDGYPDYSVSEGLQSLKACTTCTTKLTIQSVADAIDPIKINQRVASLLSTNPKLNALFWPGASTPLGPIIAAVQSSGRSKTVAVTTADAQPASLALQQKGQIAINSSTVVGWLALAGVDAVFRGLDKEAPLSPYAHRLGVMLWPTSAIPTTGKTTYQTMDDIAQKRFDYVTPYAKAWNLDLSGF